MAEQQAVAHRVAAGGSVRPAPQQQFKLPPVALPRQPEWNAAVARWAGA